MFELALFAAHCPDFYRATDSAGLCADEMREEGEGIFDVGRWQGEGVVCAAIVFFVEDVDAATEAAVVDVLTDLGYRNAVVVLGVDLNPVSTDLERQFVVVPYLVAEKLVLEHSFPDVVCYPEAICLLETIDVLFGYRREFDGGNQVVVHGDWIL